MLDEQIFAHHSKYVTAGDVTADLSKFHINQQQHATTYMYRLIRFEFPFDVT
jgi:hypothetical protein